MNQESINLSSSNVVESILDDCSQLATDCPKTGYVHSFDTGSMVDGPGPRVCVFLAGCPLKCQFCHNPDTRSARNGKSMHAEEVLAFVEKYASFLRASRGGVTLTGGEPLLQMSFAGQLLDGFKKMSLHTAVETSGCVGNHVSDTVLSNTDLFMLDVKGFSEATYKKVSGGSIEKMKLFADQVASAGKPIWLSLVLVPNLTDSVDELVGLATWARSLGVVQRIDIRPFHQLGANKWKDLGIVYPLEHACPPTPEQLRIAQDYVKKSFEFCASL